MKKHQEYFLYAVVILISALILLAIHRFFFEFNNTEVKRIIAEEANEYTEKGEVSQLIHESVNSILRNGAQVRMIRRYARATGMSKEQVLVDTAVVQAQNLQYISK